MDQEKTVHFSILKQKIIKTDEVLRMYVDVSNKFKKAQQAYKDIRSQYDQIMTNFGRLKLEHERCTFNIENLKQRNATLDQENRDLREQKLLLEEQYNQQTVQSQLNIKYLQDELQLLRDINSAAKNCSPKKRRAPSKTFEKQIENGITSKNHVKVNENLTVVNSGKHSDSVNKCDISLIEKEINEDSFQVEILEGNYSVSHEITDEIINKKHVEKNDNNVYNKEKVGTEKNCKFVHNIGTQTHKSKIERKNVYTQTLETIKTFQIHDLILSENQQLKQTILECNTEIIKLRATKNPKKKSHSTQTEKIEIYDKSVEDILKEMVVPNLLSPMSLDTNENLNLVETLSTIPTNINSFTNPSTVPEIIVIPPTPMKKNMDTDFVFTKEQVYNNNAESIADTNGLIKSLARNDKVCTTNSKNSRRYKYRSPFISSEFINNFVKLRKRCLRRLTKKRYILNQEIRKIRKLRKQDYLLKTLCTLKQLNINFTISNDSTFYGSKESQDLNYPEKDDLGKKIFIPTQKAETYSTEQLNCTCKKCKPSSMLLSKVNGETHLLGFYSIKNEISTPASSRMENKWDTKSFDTLKLVNFSRSSNNTSEDVLEALAEMVSKKLEGNKVNNVSKIKSNLDQSDTFGSETETEIERLFNKSSKDVLKRNKMLLEVAKKQHEIEYEKYSQETGDFSMDSGDAILTETVEDFNICLTPLRNAKEMEHSALPDDSSLTENVERYDFELPSCPPLLSPIKSLKHSDIPKRRCLGISLNDNEEASSGSICESSYQKCQNSGEISLCDIPNISDCNDYDGGRLANTEETTESNITLRNAKLQENCIIVTKKVATNDNLTIARNIEEYKDTNLLIEYSNKCSFNTNLHEKKFDIPIVEKNRDLRCHSNNVIEVDDLKQLSYPLKTKFIKEQENYIIPLKESDICSPSKNLQVFVTSDLFDGVQNCPESPVPCDTNVEVKSPILIPLEKLEKEECTKTGKVKHEIEMSSSSRVSILNNSNLTPTPQNMIRRSKRISQKRKYSNLSECPKVELNKPLSGKSQELKCLHLTNGFHPWSCDNNLLEELPPLEDFSKVFQSKGSSASIQVESFHANVCENKAGTVTKSNRRKCISKLKSQVLKQVRAKRQMFRTDAECHTLKINDKSTIKGSKLATQDNKSVKKINIVQNILIPANSSYAVDLLKGEHNFESVVENCDIRLNSEQNSSQNNTTVFNCLSNEKSVDTNIGKLPSKKKRMKNNCDLLSKIIKEMDKDRPEVVSKKKQIVGLKETVPDSTDEKQWRKGVLVIAENIHNVSSKPVELRASINNKAFNANTKLTVKRKILLSRLLKLSSEEKIPDEIILEFKRQDVDSITEMILQKVSKDIWDKPDDKYYPAPLMTQTQRILLGLMVRLEQESVENVMDMFLSKVETFLFKIGCGLRTLTPIVRLYMAVCKLRRDIDKIRNFCCDAFFFMGDFAVPLFFTILTSWIEVLPMESEVKNYPLAKILIQVVHLKRCNKPGYNLLPLKFLFNQFYGYPKERWNCDEIFEEVFQQYIRNPDKSTDIAIRLLCKNKDTKWVYKKVNEFFKPLIYKIPSENVNFKATAIILIGNICKHFKPKNEFDESSLNDLRRWLIGLTEDLNVHNLITKSVDLSLSKLPKKKMIVKKAKPSIKKVINRVKKKNGRMKKLQKKKATVGK